MDTPYQWTKQVASHWGGTRNGTIVHWPKGIKAKGEIRNQFHHVIDVAPTDSRSGRPARAVHGQRRRSRSRCRASAWRYSVRRRQSGGTARDAIFRDVRQSRNLSQGLDRGNASLHALGFDRRDRPPFDDDVWELYDANKDWSPGARPVERDAGEAARTAAPVAHRGDAQQRLADGRPIGRALQSRHRRPAALVKGDSQVLANGMGGLNENGVINVKNKNHSVTAQLTSRTARLQMARSFRKAASAAGGCST